jgi:tetratricopeptide (TPR) repeat protein
MKSSAPARPGHSLDRLVPRLCVPLFGLVLSGCAIVSPSPETSGATARAGSAPPGIAAGESAVRGSPAGSSAQAPPGSPAQGKPAATDKATPPAGPDDAAPADSDQAEPPAAPAAAPAAGTQADAVGDVERLPDVPLTSELMFLLLASEVAAQRGEVGSAVTTYLSMARETRDPRLARRATELALSERALDPALQAATLWHELAPASALAAQTLETLWVSTGRLAEAEPLLRARLDAARAEGRLPQAYSQIQTLLARTSDKSGALAMLQRLSARDPKVPQAHLAVAAQASAAGDHELSAREAAAAFALAPADESIAVSAAQYVAQGSAGLDGAIALLQGFLERQPRSTEARFALARLLAGAERDDDAREQFELALKEDPTSPAILFSLAQLAWQTKHPKDAERYLNRYLGLPDGVPHDDSPAWLFLGQIAESDGRIDQAIERFGKVQPGEQYVPAVIRRALLISRQGRLEEAREVLHNAFATNNRDRVQLILGEAQVLRDAHRDDEAFQVLGQALERLPENPDLLYDYAMAAERLDRLELMETTLRKLIALRPDYAHAYNALGYTFADRNIRLEEAQRLIEKALELRPGDPNILDSMGWVLYRRGDMPGALAILRKAYALSPVVDIAVHLGEILWKTGKLDEARKVWRDARALEPGNEALRETLARLNVTL